MSYQAFALKYRPQNFDQVVGQEHIVLPLREAISSNRVHHAYLFSGPRGIGKTSLARILAKSLNCKQGPTPTPCLRCPSCLDIAKAKSLDIIEIDGASNRGIDEIRSLRENVKLSPASSRFKIYIIDEVHMLTKEAFNALLKTLEEPPEHVKFIFATTDPHKVLPTILSRCQKFQFNLLSLAQIIEKLKKIAKAEKLKVDQALFYTIAQAAEGSIRDAESLFDQVFPVLSSGQELKDILSFLGIIDESSLNKLVKFITEGDLVSSLDFVDQIRKEGKDMGVFLDYFIKYLRNLILAKIDPTKFKKIAEVSPQSRIFLVEAAAKFSLVEILKLVDFLIKAKETSRQINSAYIPLELALIKFLHKEGSFEVEKREDRAMKKQRCREVERQRSKDIEKQRHREAETQRSGEAEMQESKEIERQRGKEVETQRGKDAPAESTESNPEDSQPEVQASVLDDILVQPIKVKWQEILSSMQKERMAVASHLSFGWAASSLGRQVFIAFSKKDKFHKEALDSEKTRTFIENKIKTAINKEVRVKFKIEDIAPDQAPNPKKDSFHEGGEGVNQAEEDNNFLNELLDTFEGKFHSDG